MSRDLSNFKSAQSQAEWNNQICALNSLVEEQARLIHRLIAREEARSGLGERGAREVENVSERRESMIEGIEGVEHETRAHNERI